MPMRSTPPYTTKVTFTGIPHSAEIEEYTTKKLAFLEKFLAHFREETGELLFEVEVGKTTAHHKEGDVYRAEINFSAGGVRLRAVGTKDDLHSALDDAKDEMQRELVNHKEKHTGAEKKEGRKMKSTREVS
ncbi:MAG: ribosomal subunit interface protein [Candidatus Lloydbacteria bacterium RIFCSPHIGHO2_02_FULL_51_22]|uniref:Ribosomal subunit interface protein n=2 Tax=Candidatus Lloydiibacteriota TaxID=1817910 RepID=A0A1G2DDK6_9BACT|nr:MAG: ribosomal subunit interface protein [Candidatus Lloydbacteria bacterium RIFCSPHIGHO2_02_FULL_51_22]OGZ14152.1 MAG: ribosomal subunit interface protein [Candidatus Lloydbacteria bacterium RIFCSPLOWO2_02_FULL_51_11]